MLSMSTIWEYAPDRDARVWLARIKDLGFDAVELAHKTNKDQLSGLIPLLEEFNLSVSSVHNFCPVPYDAPSPRHASNYYRLSSVNEEERQRAVQWTKNTIDTAVQVMASAVVLHAGTVELKEDPSPRLFELFLEGQGGTDAFIHLRDDILRQRGEVKAPYIDAIARSLAEVLPYAKEKNIRLGLETRYYPVEMPNFEEFGYLFNLFPHDNLFYWHDVGHAEINDRLGICPHEDFLKAYAHKLIGMHLHGFQGRRDHLAPIKGDMSFDKILPYLKEGILRVLEPQFATDEEVRESVEMFA